MNIFSTSRIKVILTGLLVFLLINPLSAGNNDRAGSAGAGTLLLLPWSRTASLSGSNLSSVSGMEAMAFNVAGMGLTKGIDIGWGEILYMGTNSGITVNTFAAAFRMGESSSTLGFNITFVSFGDIEITTGDNPEGGIGQFSPNTLNIGLSYAKEFSNSIYGGFTLKVVNESSANVSATAVAFDAGIDYITGPRKNFKFGISLRNVGSKMTFKGDGLDVQGTVQNSSSVSTLKSLAQPFQLPAQLGIGLSYDFFLSESNDLAVNFTFLANSFTKDQFNFGVGYSFKDILNINFGYLLESDINNKDKRNTVYTGPSMGATVNIPLGKGGVKLGLDYAYRFTNPFGGFNQFGIRLSF